MIEFQAPTLPAPVTHGIIGLLDTMPVPTKHENATAKIYCTNTYWLTKISIWAKRSISRVFSLFIVPSPFFVHCPYKGRINRAESVLTGLKAY